ncbi:MAG: sulfatase [Lentisphaerae bacterium]|jgi:arylsulfatase A-like enzyme|nr:sulfatase [Lentisphaerota bacterium]MBT4818870.1 sulfatase [Lentisphaerota bacterium]MBT5604364.1 sulfatase [Lentisphaerota bacterium]MBT7059000.1 sulfatase [Lentisphaerota bacterium]MBT7844999.1 sulfatase [Lentisphaerota bacterium]
MNTVSTPQPNIVLFLVDDMGWQDTSEPFWTERTPFNDRYRTPNMERLARTGMKFTQAYACAVCSPTRVSLLTGLNAARHRVTNWTMVRDEARDAPSNELEFPEWNMNGICPDGSVPNTVQARCLPSYLAEAGYRTIHVGKAHFGASDTPGADPLNLGFEVNIAGHAAGGPGSYLSEQGFSGAWRQADLFWDIPDLEEYHDTGTFLTEALTLEAIRETKRAVADSKPFFLYMSHYAVHVPFAEDPRFIGRYLDEGLDHTEAMYAALLEGMDKSLGDILDMLEEQHVADDTIVIFMSDNGGLSAHGRGGEPHSHNKPLSSGKGSAHEGGIREPMIVRWPGVTEADTTCDDAVIIEDFLPSILEMAGTPDAARTDGISFVPQLRGERGCSRGRPLFWHFPNRWGPTGPGIGSYSSIRRDDWKLIYYHEPSRPERYELFNITEDIGETCNLAGKQPAVREELSSQLRDFLLSVDAQMPTDKQTGDAVPLP